MIVGQYLLQFVVILLIPSPSFSFGSFGRIQHVSRGRAIASSMGAHEPALRIGHGFDIHRLIEGTRLVIAGVTIPHTLGADAHSDGDAVYHSIVDSILGALTMPDIGQLFPDNDPRFKVYQNLNDFLFPVNK